MEYEKHGSENKGELFISTRDGLLWAVVCHTHAKNMRELIEKGQFNVFAGGFTNLTVVPAFWKDGTPFEKVGKDIRQLEISFNLTEISSIILIP